MTIHEGGDDFEPLGEEEPVSEEEFAEEVRELVAEDAPQLFALVEEHGERDNAWVYAWGIAFDHHVEIITTRSGLRRTFGSVEHAHRRCSQRRKLRLVWPNPLPPRRPEPVS
ncbi:MAG: hypothetical protein ACRDRI_14265 [Pseudonocardiaceae bacterium]